MPLAPIFAFSLVHCERPYIVIHYTSAVYNLLWGYSIPAPTYSKPKKRMQAYTIHAAWEIPVIHCNYFQPVIHMLSWSPECQTYSSFNDFSPRQPQHKTEPLIKWTFLRSVLILLLHLWIYPPPNLTSIINYLTYHPLFISSPYYHTYITTDRWVDR